MSLHIFINKNYNKQHIVVANRSKFDTYLLQYRDNGSLVRYWIGKLVLIVGTRFFQFIRRR